MNKKIIYYFVFFVIILAYIGIKANNFEYGFSDENTYMYMAKLSAEGKMPYKDFFLSHPPLQIFLLAAFIKIFGFNFIILKLLPTLFTIVSAFFLFLIMKRFGFIHSITGVLFFLFSYDSLRFSSYNMGVEIALMFVVIGFYLFFSKKFFFFSGALFGLAGLTRFIALIPFFVILLFLFFKNKKYFLKFLAGFSITFILVNLILILAFGSDYITQVFKYHLLKPKTAGERKFDIFYRMFKVNFFLFLPSLLFFVDKKRKEIGIAVIIATAYILFLALLNKVFGYYFIFLFPFLAIIGSYSLINLLERIKINKNIIYSVLFLGIVIFSFFFVKDYLSYNYQDFNNAEEVSNYIKANSNQNDEIFGDDSIVPLIALLSKRNIALDFADSNNLRFRSGVTDINNVIKALNQSNAKFIINYKENIRKLTAIYGPAYMDEFSNFLKDECEIVKIFSDKWNDREKLIEIYDCKK